MSNSVVDLRVKRLLVSVATDEAILETPEEAPEEAKCAYHEDVIADVVRLECDQPMSGSFVQLTQLSTGHLILEEVEVIRSYGMDNTTRY